jgi:hypothetical protein
MAGVLFVDFDWMKSGVAPTFSNNWAEVSMPLGMYHNNGAATLDPAISPPNVPQGNSVQVLAPGVATNSAAYGPYFGGIPSQHQSGYGAATSTTRTAFAAAKGFQLSLVRSVYPQITNEIFMTFDFRHAFVTHNSSLSSSYSPSADWEQLFIWGDLSLRCKQLDYASAVITHVVSLYNGAAEVATVSFPEVVQGSWHHVRIHAKLDVTTGAFNVTVDGYGHASYTNQNTVGTIALGSAVYISFSPPVYDNGTNAYVGLIDNVYIDNDSFPTGRISAQRGTISADSTNTGWGAYGTGATTLTDAVSSGTDAKAIRSLGGGSLANFTITVPANVSLESEVIGATFHVRVCNRDAVQAKKLAVGMEMASVFYPSEALRSVILPLGVPTHVPPNSTAVIMQGGMFNKTGNTRFTHTEMLTWKLYVEAQNF